MRRHSSRTATPTTTLARDLREQLEEEPMPDYQRTMDMLLIGALAGQKASAARARAAGNWFSEN